MMISIIHCWSPIIRHFYLKICHQQINVALNIAYYVGRKVCIYWLRWSSLSLYWVRWRWQPSSANMIWHYWSIVYPSKSMHWFGSVKMSEMDMDLLNGLSSFSEDTPGNFLDIQVSTRLGKMLQAKTPPWYREMHQRTLEVQEVEQVGGMGYSLHFLRPSRKLLPRPTYLQWKERKHKGSAALLLHFTHLCLILLG